LHRYVNTDEANAIARWIQNWKKTYKENPKLNVLLDLSGNMKIKSSHQSTRIQSQPS
tara:strand:+ start:143 stop:313 length:171 start_codon:yes stop_codon:yes gene_type:complete